MISGEEKILKNKGQKRQKGQKPQKRQSTFFLFVGLSYVICMGLPSNFKAVSLTGSDRVGWA